jgi:hypothetical protein
VGGIAGQLYLIGLDNCSNTGSTVKATGYTIVDGEKGAFAGGFVGYGYLASNCTNEAEVLSTGDGSYVGGIMGFTDPFIISSMANLKNNAKISGNRYVGGLLGYVNISTTTNDSVTFSQFENTAEVSGKGDYVGGVIGYFSGSAFSSSGLTLNAMDFISTGLVSGKANTGMLFGYGETDSTKSAIVDAVYSGNAGQLKNITVTKAAS